MFSAAPQRTMAPVSPDTPLPLFADPGTDRPTPRCPDELVTVLRTDAGGDAVVLRVSGEVDNISAPLVRSRVTEALGAGGRLILDLSAVQFFGTAGMAVLVQARGESARHDTDLWLAAPARSVLRPMTVCGLLELFQVAATVVDALAALPRQRTGSAVESGH